MRPSYALGYIVGTVLRFVAGVLLIGLAPVLMFWLYLAASVGWLLGERGHR
jgi:hypothetical protein